MAKELFDCWVYHKEHAAKIVKSDEAKKLYGQGWEDSPAKCKEEVKPKLKLNKKSKK